MVNILDSLNTEQKKCVEKISGPMIIISGPGSGKTQSNNIKNCLPNIK